MTQQSKGLDALSGSFTLFDSHLYVRARQVGVSDPRNVRRIYRVTFDCMFLRCIRYNDLNNIVTLDFIGQPRQAFTLIQILFFPSIYVSLLR